MTTVVIPVTNQPNQTFTTTIDVNGENRNFRFFFTWNGCGKYWEFDLFDDDTEEQLLSRIPVMTNLDGNMIPQYAYKRIGRCFLLNINGTNDYIPSQSNLGTDFLLIWTDNE